MLVHGEGHKMEFLKHKIRSEYGIECFMPANGQTAVVKTPVSVPVAISRTLLDEEAERYVPTIHTGWQPSFGFFGKAIPNSTMGP